MFLYESLSLLFSSLSLWDGGADAAHRDVTLSVRRCSERERECSGTLMSERREEEEKVFDERDPVWRHLLCYYERIKCV